LQSYEANNARVRSVVPDDQLVVQDHAQGWKKLCAFLGKNVPETEYPHSNSCADFKAFFLKLGVLFIGGATVAVL
jgi:hypothetical protein